MIKLQTRGLRAKRKYDLNTPWADNRIASTKALSGREIAIVIEDGPRRTYSFGDDHVTVTGDDVNGDDTRSYDAVEERDGIFFVQMPRDDKKLTTSLVVNFNTGGGILLTMAFVDGPEKLELEQTIQTFVIDGTDGVVPHLTDELVGKRAYAEYADGHTAEHIYVNPRRLGWQGLGGFDYSGSEMDDSTTWKVDDDLFLLSWVEEWQAVGAALLMDFDQLRNVGILFGRDGNGDVHTLCGARLAKLGQIEYPAGYEPPGVEGATVR